MNDEEITASFYEKELQKTKQKKFRIEKILKGKGDMSNGKDTIIQFNSWINEKDLYKNESIIS